MASSDTSTSVAWGLVPIETNSLAAAGLSLYRLDWFSRKLPRVRLPFRRSPVEDLAESPLDPVCVRLGFGFLEDPFSKSPGGLDKSRVIEEDEGLLRNVGTGAFGGAFFPARCIKGDEGGVREAAAEEGIEAAAVSSVCALLPSAAGEVQMLPVACGLVGLDAAAADLVVEEPAEVEEQVADKFGVEAESGLAEIKAVGGSDLLHFSGDLGGLAVGAAEEDLPDGAFWFQPFSWKSWASQSRSFGWVGYSPLATQVIQQPGEPVAHEEFPESVNMGA